MSPPQLPPTVLLLLPDEDPGLCAVMQSSCGECRVQRQAFHLETWLSQEPDVEYAGVLVDTDKLALADLRVIAASLASHVNTWLILLVGDRGLAGFEEMLERPRTAVLPKPWTPNGIEQAFRSIQPRSSTPGAFPRVFLDGLVEGLRDPLTSISGYLQLLGNHDNENIAALVSPALDAAAQLSAQLEFLHLAAAELHAHPDSYDLRHIAEELVQYAERAGVEVRLDTDDDIRVEADIRYLRAAMQSAFLLLQRFGSGGPLRLEARQVDGCAELLWVQEAPAHAPQHPLPPPAYLEDLFERLCRRIAAQAVMKHVFGDIPNILGVRW